MTIEEIETFINSQAFTVKDHVKIDFKKRETIYGLFVKGYDYNHLKSKNFWRIVTKPNFKQWQKSGDLNLAKIFSGSEITRLKSAV